MGHVVVSEPNFQDVVRHKTADVSGTVIARYPNIWDGEIYLDVREGTDKIYWETPAKNWETVIAYKEE